MKRWMMLLLALLCLVPAAAVHAGGGGIIKLTEPVGSLAVGKHPIKVQALQHGVTPRAEAKVSISGVGPDGQTVTVPAERDPASGSDYVYVAQFPFSRAGKWRLTITAEHTVIFPPKVVDVTVTPAAGLAAAGPLPLALGGGVLAAGAFGFVLWRRRAAHTG